MSVEFDSFDGSDLKAYVESPLHARNLGGKFQLKIRIGVKMWHGYPGFRHGFPFYFPDWPGGRAETWMGPQFLNITANQHHTYGNSPRTTYASHAEYRVNPETGLATLNAGGEIGDGEAQLLIDVPVGNPYGPQGVVFGPGDFDGTYAPTDFYWKNETNRDGFYPDSGDYTLNEWFLDETLDATYDFAKAFGEAIGIAKAYDPGWDKFAINLQREFANGFAQTAAFSGQGYQIALRSPTNHWAAGWNPQTLVVTAGGTPDGQPVNAYTIPLSQAAQLFGDPTPGLTVPGVYLVAVGIRPIFRGNTDPDGFSTWAGAVAQNGGSSANHYGVMALVGSAQAIGSYAEIEYGINWRDGLIHKLSAIDQPATTGRTWEPRPPDANYWVTWKVIFIGRKAASIPGPYDVWIP